jgi:hypothetical protein
MAVGGVLVDAGVIGLEGEGFFRNGIENLHEFHFGSLVLGLGSWGSVLG